MIFINRDYKLYVHISPSGKRYYGITKQKPKKRWKNGRGYKNNRHFTDAINKYGWDNFQHEVLFDDLTEDEAKLLEQFYIVLYDTTSRDKGYNITLGGDGTLGHEVTEETKYKLSEGNKGKVFSKEHKQKISESLKGIHRSEDTKQKMRGKKSEEARKKMSESKKGIYGGKSNPSAKSVICLTTKRMFFTTKEAAEYYNTNSSAIIGCCKGKRKSFGKLKDGTKLVWKYLTYKHDKKYRIIENFKEAS